MILVPHTSRLSPGASPEGKMQRRSGARIRETARTSREVVGRLPNPYPYNIPAFYPPPKHVISKYLTPQVLLDFLKVEALLRSEEVNKAYKSGKSPKARLLISYGISLDVLKGQHHAPFTLATEFSDFARDVKVPVAVRSAEEIKMDRRIRNGSGLCPESGQMN